MHRNILRRVLQLTVLVGMRLTVTLSNSSDLPPTLSFDIQQLNARIEKGKGQMDKLMLKAATQGTDLLLSFVLDLFVVFENRNVNVKS